jgi:hypothetical protein
MACQSDYFQIISKFRLLPKPVKTSPGFVNVEFFLDVIESYLPALKEEIREHRSNEHGGNDHHDYLLACRMGTVNSMRFIIGELRTLLNLRHCSAPESIVAGYRDLIEEFGKAHGEKF